MIKKLLLCFGLVIVLAVTWLKPLDATADRQVDAGLKRAVASFAVARGLHAVLSALQGTELSLEPFGVGVGLAPGQVLRPFNELVGQFADAMLAASIVFAAMKILITIGSYEAVSILLSIIALIWIFFPLTEKTPPTWLSQTLLVALLVRFAIPLVAVGSDFLFERFMKADYEASKSEIEGTKAAADKFEAVAQPSTPAQPDSASAAPKTSVMARLGAAIDFGGVVERMDGYFQRIDGFVKQKFDVAGRMEAFNKKAGQAVDHIVQLIVVFLLQTLVIPLFLFWALCRVGSAALGPRRWQY